jgi:arylsulfatase A-like enzyme
MMTRTTMVAALVVAATVLGGPAPAASDAEEPAAPRLVLLVAVDQGRYDYFSRFASGFTGGLKTLMAEGAVFTNAHLDHYPSVTAVGHSAMLTGAPPSISGIIGNDWYDRAEKRNLTSVEDPDTQRLGAAEAEGSSPHRLRVSTVGDELKMAHPGSRVVTLSFKDRSAILMGGRMADLALWWDSASGAFVTSTWYGAALPDWVGAFNAARPADAWLGKDWRAITEDGTTGTLLKTLPATAGPEYYGSLYDSAFGNDLLVSLAEKALESEGLGTRDTTDILALSFSCNDEVGHGKGPHSAEVHAITVGTDRALGRLLEAVDRQVGLDRTLVVLTADHGVAPVPNQMQEWRMPGGRFSRGALEVAARAALEEAFGPGEWLEGRAGSALYLNWDLIAQTGIEAAVMERVLASALERVPPVWRAYTRSELLEGRVPPDPWSRRVALSFDRERSGDVEVLLEPYWIASILGTTHGTPFSYDTHIPLVLMGPGIQAGRYHGGVVLNDLAPTLATLLGIETPSGSSGRALSEALSARAAAGAGTPRSRPRPHD